MDELYIPKKGFQDLFQALLENYKREAQAIIDEVDNKEPRNEDWLSDVEFKDWIDRLGAEVISRIDALDERYKPRFRGMAEEIIKFPQKSKSLRPLIIAMIRTDKK